LEALDDRIVPSQIALTVSSLADSGPSTLRAAIMSADAGSHSDKFTIDFAVTGMIDLQSPLPELNNSIAIQGPGASSLTLERAAGFSFSSAIVTVDAGQTASLSGLTIANANHHGIDNSGTLAVSGCVIANNRADSPLGAGGIFNFGTLTVSNSTLENNSGIDGGAIINWVFSTLRINNCTLHDNHASVEGGAILNYGTATIEQGSTLSCNTAVFGGGVENRGTLTVSGSTLAGNSATQGGGIHNHFGGTLTVAGTTLSGNVAIEGGAIFNVGPEFGEPGGVLTVRDSCFGATVNVLGTTFSGNSATSGAGIDNLGALDVRGSTFTANAATDSGGGIYNLGTTTLQQCTLSGNTAGSKGGGIFNGAAAALVVKDSAVLHNVAPGGADIYNLGVLTLDDSTVGVIGP
jgi:hypothetical protein